MINLTERVTAMQRNISKKIVCEDKFARKYYLCLHNHRQGWSKMKARQRKETRRKLKSEMLMEIIAYQRKEQEDADFV